MKIGERNAVNITLSLDVTATSIYQESIISTFTEFLLDSKVKTAFHWLKNIFTEAPLLKHLNKLKLI